MIAVGDSVTYTRAFLRRLSYYATEFDDRGVVLELRHDARFALVEWTEGHKLVAVGNLCKRVYEEGRLLDKDSDVRPFPGRWVALDTSE